MKGFESIGSAQKDHSPERLNANVAKAGLAYVHMQKGPTKDSLERLLTLGPVVTRPEFEVVCRALHVEPRSIPEAMRRWYKGDKL